MFNHRISEIFPYLFSQFNPSDIILVESDINTWSNILKNIELNVHYVYTDTNNNFSKNNIPGNWNIYNTLLWNKKEIINYYTLSNSLLNGTISSDVLKNIWKNIETASSNPIETTDIQDFLDFNMTKDNDKFLIIDTLDALNRIKNLNLEKNNISMIAARVLKKDLESLSKTQLDTYMKSQGYKEIAFYEDHYPDMGVVIYIVEYKEKIQNLRQELVTKEKNIKLEKEKIDNILNEKNNLELKLSETKGYFENSRKQAIDFQEKLEKERNNNKLFQDKIQNEMKKGFTNSIKQIESFISLQNYLIAGQQPLNFHGWPISPDIALFLIQKIEQNDYDLIIEFGSGTSTSLIASILKKRDFEVKKQTKLITFEHNKKYYEQTLADIKNKSIDDYVDLVYAPLIEYFYEKEKYLYYSCEGKFAELKLIFNKEIQKILVLVDGPPGDTGPLARFPALPHLMKEFNLYKLDLVLDDYSRNEEIAIAKKWEELLKDKNIEFNSESVPSEKGLYFCRININK